ncbi:SigB/SigF/SigG family RNA polymerase sigma factor [Kitasatospora acidiphila]|uniref:SigB/SigF/SigG family RNA polymerase sigma factor n=1 Tax=Kitasatospora acidiphila TaxID=2567942 RepID=A0A540VYF9_9ACTN|nr:SigB/SigF/SigG family RNA polymerase sigma factor [Kitasatospora acidiphila]TQF01144.1 SigB/SigF/SigG family RNA polymerase sigma factor [Kitasatospora acidiphila]
MPTAASRPSTTARVNGARLTEPAPDTGELTGLADLVRLAADLDIDLGDPAETVPDDARKLSRVLLARLRATEDGTAEYSYVRGTLIELNTALVKFAASRFAHRKEPMDDILQVGTIGLIKAIDRFDPSYNVEFSTFALPTISGEIKRFFRDTSWMVHVPRRLQELRLTLAKATDAIEQQLDREPTPAELAAHLDLTKTEVLEGLTAAQAQSAGFLDTTAPGSGPGEGGGLAADQVAREERAFETVLCLEALKPLIAALPQREHTILSLRFGAELTQAQIGRHLGISQMHVSRLLNRTLTDLRAALLTED